MKPWFVWRLLLGAIWCSLEVAVRLTLHLESDFTVKFSQRPEEIYHGAPIS